MFVSIAIPFYNAEQFLPEAIRSVFAQTHSDWELVLINDGSTDNSLNIAQAVNDPRVRVISDGKNKRLAARLNEFVALAKYEYILRMDADDLMVPTRIEELLRMIEQSGADLVTSGVYSVRNNLDMIGCRGQDFTNPTFQDILSRKIGITHAALLARKSWYIRNKYDEGLSIAQDLDLWLRASFKKDLKIISTKKPLYIYREENNVTADKLLRAYRNERKMIKRYTKSLFNILILKSYLKTTAVAALNMFGKIEILQKRRGSGQTTLEDELTYWEAIKKIQNTTVKGIDA